MINYIAQLTAGRIQWDHVKTSLWQSLNAEDGWISTQNINTTVTVAVSTVLSIITAIDMTNIEKADAFQVRSGSFFCCCVNMCRDVSASVSILVIIALVILSTSTESYKQMTKTYLLQRTTKYKSLSLYSVTKTQIQAQCLDCSLTHRNEISNHLTAVMGNMMRDP